MFATVPSAARRFASLHPEVEGVLQRCAHRTWDLLLIDVHGEWTRAITPSEDHCRALARRLGVRLHTGFDDPRLARRMNASDPWSNPSATRRAL